MIEASSEFTNAFLNCFPTFRTKHIGIPKKKYFENRFRQVLMQSINDLGTIYKCDPRISYTKEDTYSYERKIISQLQDRAKATEWFTLADIGIERKIKEGLNANLKQGLISLCSGILNIATQGVIGKIKLAKVTLVPTGTLKSSAKALGRGGYREVVENGVTTIMFLPQKLVVRVEKIAETVIVGGASSSKGVITKGGAIGSSFIGASTTGVKISISHSVIDKMIQFFWNDSDTLTLSLFAPVDKNAATKTLSLAGDIITDIIPGTIGTLSTVLKTLFQVLASLYGWRCDIERERTEDHNWNQHEINHKVISGSIATVLCSDGTHLKWGDSSNLALFEQLTRVLCLTHLMWGKD